MRYDSLFVAGLGSLLPPPVSIEEHIAMGLYDPEEQEDTGQRAVAIAGPDDTQPDMAARAGLLALERSALGADAVSLLLHAVTAHNGLDGWNAAAYLQRRILPGGSGLAMEVRQLSNGAMAAIELAAAYLAADTRRTAALITSADRFSSPAYDRWHTSWGLVFADGASAAVLSRDSGIARVLSCVTVSDPELEGMHRGSLPFTAAPDPEEYPLNFRARTLDFAKHMSLDETGRRLTEGLRAAVTQATAEAAIDVADADHYVLPGFGRRMLHRECLDPLGIPLDRTTFDWHARVGHLGAADQFASLTHLSEAGRLMAGQHVLLVGIGGGFNWTCAVLSVVAPAPWAY